MIAEGLALIDKAMRHRRPGPYQVQAAIAALHARAARPEDTDWAQIDLLYATLERAAALAGGHAQPRRRGLQGARAGGGAGDDRAAGRAAVRLFPFLRRQGRACCCSSAAHEEARVAFDRAIALANTAAEAAHIRQHLDRIARMRRGATEHTLKKNLTPGCRTSRLAARPWEENRQRRTDDVQLPPRNAGHELVLTRLIDAPREKLYRAWTEPELMKQWFAPLPWTDAARRGRPAAGRQPA